MSSCQRGGKKGAYSVSLDIAVDQFPGFGVHGYGAGAVDDAVGDDGLGVDAWKRLGGLFGEDGGFGCHFFFLLEVNLNLWLNYIEYSIELM